MITKPAKLGGVSSVVDDDTETPASVEEVDESPDDQKKSPKIEYDLKKKTPFELHNQFVEIIEQNKPSPKKINK